MSYVLPLTVKLTLSVCCVRYGENTGDLCKTLMSLQEPDMPKYACQIQRSCVATASRIIVGDLPLPVNCPFQDAGQLRYSQYMQSMLPNIPCHPRCSFNAKMRAMSSRVGARRYCCPKILMTATQK
jgi:hypothetical protein